MDVVLYLRYSSDKQTEQSIEGQMHVCKDYCAHIGYNIVGMYIDRALSASKNTEKRVEFQKMIRDSEKHQWQGVVVYKLDRFARNRYDSAIYKARLKKNGVRVISATENISDNPEGVILEAVLEGMAEFYSKELSQKVTRGMRETALKANSCGGQVSLGYKVENKKLVPDPVTAPLVREAFELYADGWSVADICRKFNNAGYRTKRGTPFNKNSFRVMFHNKKYIGVYKYDDIEIEGGIPPLVSRETFDRVQARIKQIAAAPARGKAIVDYMLSGKIFCGHCGSPMVGMGATSHTGRKYFYYTCSNRRNNGGCNKSHVRKEAIEEAVVKDALTLITPDFIDYLADITMKAAEQDIAQNTLIPSLKAQIADHDKSIGRLMKLVEAGAESPTLAKRLTELEQQKRAAEKQLIKEEASIPTITREDIVGFLHLFLLGNPEDVKFQRRILDMLVNSVFVWDETSDTDDDSYMKLTICFNLVPKVKHTITPKELTQASSHLSFTVAPIRAYANLLFIRRDVFAITVKHRF